MKQYLSFSVGEELFMINISQVHSIVKKQANEIRPLPDSPPFFLGLTQLRESTIGILSASILFNKKVIEKDELDVVIIRIGDDQLYGIIVDMVHGVETVEEDELQSNDMMSQLNQYVMSIYRDRENDKMYLIIDANRLVEIKNIKEVKYENNI